MRTTQELFNEYEIMPGLAMHQLRVAAVGKMVCESMMRDIDTRAVIMACLLHDMGNIIKSDLVTFPEFIEPLGRAHWQIVKDRYIGKYGNDEHEATIAIAREIAAPEIVLRLIDGVGFSKLDHIRKGDSYEQKICEYADARVGPHGVLTLDSRLEEAKARYAGRHTDIPRSEDEYRFLHDAAREIERQIFDDATISPDDITEESIRPLVEELRDYPVA